LAIGLPWLPIPGATPPELAVQRARGHFGVVIQRFEISPDGRTIATVDDRGRVRLRPAVETGGIERTLDAPGSVVTFSPDGHRLAVGAEEPDVILCDLDRPGRGRPLGIPVQRTSALRFSPDGRILAVSSYCSREIILWDIETGRQWMSLRGHSGLVCTISFAPDGRSLASASGEAAEVFLWDLDTGRPQHCFNPDGVRAVSLAYSPDGRLLAAANAFERQVRIWEVPTGTQFRPIAGQSRPACSVAFSPNGRLLATTGDGTASLWSAATGQELQRLDGQADLLSQVAFTPDGRTLVATGNDDDIRFWNLSHRISECVEPPPENTER
jgi:WD40 repeat protein